MGPSAPKKGFAPASLAQTSSSDTTLSYLDDPSPSSLSMSTKTASIIWSVMPPP
eukprot:CAMPEP_0169436104 /NCGR_PEP_ID=MMETSP1042-20121227/5416_1 /TAXON_ID=464988 /ORGANISM="Hemiselmis andersenii, Strain CCMP1180" /LENGTH=53 /DNA_ID=CAMNT_0009546787 /DNA_START=136 /DNA_END=294 /DNA_ORIENTATION=+